MVINAFQFSMLDLTFVVVCFTHVFLLAFLAERPVLLPSCRLNAWLCSVHPLRWVKIAVQRSSVTLGKYCGAAFIHYAG